MSIFTGGSNSAPLSVSVYIYISEACVYTKCVYEVCVGGVYMRCVYIYISVVYI